jgi:glycosyltransferase involved in cell wall biosynthesis
MKPKVTVWIPSYNHAQYLPAAVESVLAQSFKDFELIIVDDGSRDDSLAIAQSYAAQYPEVISVYTHDGHVNRGISETVNLAFMKSRGEYVGGLPSDDLLKPRKLERQVAFLEKYQDIGWVYGPVKVLNESDAKGIDIVWGADITRDENPLESLIKENTVHGLSVLMRRRSVEQVGLHDPTLVYSDWDFWIRFIAVSKPAFLQEPLAVWRIHGHNTSTSSDERLGFVRLAEVMLAVRGKSSTLGGALARPRTQALLDLQASFYLYMAGNHDQARESLRRAGDTDPSVLHSTAYFMDWFWNLPDTAAIDEEMQNRRSKFADWLSRNLPNSVGGRLSRQLSSAKFRAAALEHYYSDLSLARRMALRGVRLNPSSVRDPELRRVLLRSLAGEHLIKWLRRIKHIEPSNC